MRKVSATVQPGCSPGVHRIASYQDAAGEWEPGLRFLIPVMSEEEREGIERLQRSGLRNVAWVRSDQLHAGDVVAWHPNRLDVTVLLRESDTHHALFLTNRCNSRCLMCSQPPTAVDDSWLVEEAVEALRHVRCAPPVLGFTGGEPLLLGHGLRRILDAVARYHPSTRVEILTNARLLADASIASQILEGLECKVRWLVPIYGHTDFLHDFVVQAYGAFDETLAGILTLQANRQEIQLRTVLIDPVLRVLPEFAGFIGRNLPFVREVALMGCEPIGFALANRTLCEVDLTQWHETMSCAVRVLARHRVPHLLMNIPLCGLPEALRPAAHRSISDWKNVYAEECATCAMKPHCSGLFAWHERGWKPTPLKPLTQMETPA